MIPISLGRVRAPYDSDGVLAHLGSHGAPGVEMVDRQSYRRVWVPDVADPSTAYVVDVSFGDSATPAATVTVPGGADALAADQLADATVRCRRLLDVETDPALIMATLRDDPVLGDLVERCPGIRAPGAWDGFELLVKVIVGQQVSVAGARTMTGRLVEAFGPPVLTDHPELTHAFPSPAELVDADLEAHGFIAARSDAIRHAAGSILDGTLRLDGDRDSVELIDQLIAVRGIGPWTATITAFRLCGDRDLFPPGDLALRRAAGSGEPIDSDELDRWSLGWSPVRSHAAHLLWRAAHLD